MRVRHRTSDLALGPLDHLVGFLAAAAVLAIDEHIVGAVAAAVGWLLEQLAVGTALGFMIFESHFSWPAFGATLALLGGTVAGADALVRRGSIRSWLVLPAFWACATVSVAALLADGEVGWQGGAIMGAGLGTALTSAFAAWWIAGTTIRRLRSGGVA